MTIAHRVRRADHVIVLERGRVVDEGPPGVVLARYHEGVDEASASATAVGRPATAPIEAQGGSNDVRGNGGGRIDCG